MNRGTARLLLRSYPRKWRAQYGPELEELLCKRAFRMGDISNVLWCGFVERMREPFAGFCFFSLAGSALTFLACVLLADPLWRTIAAPVTDVLREHGVRPNVMVQVSAFEGIEVVWLGVPALMTFFLTFALMLFLAWIFSSNIKENQRRQWANRFVVCSGTLFLLSSVLSLVAWRNGSLALLLELYPDVQNAPLLSVSHCFALLAASTMGLTLLLQIPVVTFFGWRFRAISRTGGRVI